MPAPASTTASTLRALVHAAFLFGLLCGACAVRAEFVNLEPLRAYLDAGVALSDAATSGLEAGAGKLRYGDEREFDFDPVLSEARLIAAAGFGAAWRAVLEIQYDDRARHTLDIGEATLTYRSPPVGSSRVDLQACKLEYSIVSPK